ncbi:hypothetical protein DX933_01160 [Ornithinibacillus gellani]|uniref:hypothetical protein n=1 Tax=Ornithinibacillus gellani TaxID=2293253 RepID=UPI000F473FE5|nr:hypothetical protein [Ornithinibacillus gellani]TQS76481.1 hypothetical protein DX933_01160 [Ornithinibacillus gellani]
MKKTFISVTLIAFFTVGTVIAILSTDSMKGSSANTPQYSPEAHADWPVYNFNKIINERADLVAFVTVESVEDKKVSEEEPNAKLATLKINKLLYDSRNSVDISSTVVLDQALEFVSVGESYLLFLEKNGDYYYEVNGNSKVKEENGKYQVNIEGIQGLYSQETFGEKFTSTLKEIKKD